MKMAGTSHTESSAELAYIHEWDASLLREKALQ